MRLRRAALLAAAGARGLPPGLGRGGRGVAALLGHVGARGNAHDASDGGRAPRGRRPRLRLVRDHEGRDAGQGIPGRADRIRRRRDALVGRAVFTDEQGDKVFATLKAQPLGTGRTATGDDHGRNGAVGRPRGRLHVLVEVRRRIRRRPIHAFTVNVEGRARKATPAPPRRRSRRNEPRREAWVARGVTVALGARASGSGRCPRASRRPAWHLFAIFAATIFSVIVGRLSDPDGLRPRRRGLRPLAHPAAREGLRRVRERHDPPHRRRLPRGARDREVRPRAAARPPRRGALRQIDARPRLQHLLPRRRHRAGVPEQHGALGRPLPARPLARRRLGLEAGRGDAQEDGRVPDVLRDGDAQPLVGALADGDGGQSPRRRDRQAARPQRRRSARGSSPRRSRRSCVSRSSRT